MKKTITLFLFLLTILSKQSIAQAPIWDWAKSAGGAAEDNGRSIVTDANNNVFVTGFFRSTTISFGSYTLTNADISGNTDDVFLVKYNANGVVQWAVSFGETGNDEGSGVSTDINGNLYVTGNFTSANISIGGVLLTNADASGQFYDIFLAKYDTGGNVVWAKKYGGGSDDISNGINTDIWNNTYLTGTYSSDTIHFDTTSLSSIGNLDIYLAKINGLGNVQWARFAGGDSEDKSLAVSTDSVGNIGITGYFYSDSISFGNTVLMKTDTTIDSLGNRTDDVFVARYNASGDLLWVKKAGGYGGYYDEASSNGIAMNKAGDIYITGYFRYDSIMFDGINLYNYNTSRDLFIAKYDTSGSVIWAESAGDFLDDEGRGMVVDSSGNVIITGYYSSGSISFDGNSITNPNFDSEVFVLKYDPNGTYIWAAQGGGVAGDLGNSVACFGTHNVYATGQYYSATATFDGNTISNNGMGDAFVARLYPYSTVGIAKKDINNGLTVYPNPSSSSSTIYYSLKKDSEVKVEVFNELGEKIISLVNNEKQSEGDYFYTLSVEKSGLYFVKLQTSENVLIQKILFTK